MKNAYHPNMELRPSKPPGRANRKLRAHLAEIARLRSMGYSIEGIREAFGEAGIEVSWAAVQREVARLQPSPASKVSSSSLLLSGSPDQSNPETDALSSPSSRTASSAEVDVNKFFDNFVDNPLFNRKSKP